MVDPEQTLRSVASDLDLHCLPHPLRLFLRLLVRVYLYISKTTKLKAGLKSRQYIFLEKRILN